LILRRYGSALRKYSSASEKTHMTLMRFGIAICILSVLTAPSAALFYDGNGVYKNCTTPGNFAEGFCIGYVTATYDSLILDYECPKSHGATTRQIADVVKQYLEKRPEVRNYPASMLLRAAIIKAFDCTAKP
jgi:hypothetical protein